MKKSLLAVFVLLGSFVFAQPTSSGATSDDLQLNSITTAMPFLSINPDSRSGGMGDAGTALSATPSSIYWNTAGLVFSESKSGLGISYVPWLRQLTNDIHLSYLSGYYKIGQRHAVTAGLRYFSLGNITYTDNSGGKIRDDKPSEFELVGGYAFKLSDRFSIGVNGRFAYSNLTGGLIVAGAQTKAGIAGASDLSFMYRNSDLMLGGRKGTYAFGTTINAIGNKVSYSNLSGSDFLPMNLKIGNAYTTELDSYNKFTLSLDLQKLLVPTPAIYTGSGTLLSGKNSNVGVISGLMQSFYDAPGFIDVSSGDTIFNADGTAQVVKGSRFKEELNEINIATGVEYDYNEVFAVRGGFFYESTTKGARQFFNFGVGLKYNIIGFDISYIAALKRNNPLANTLRFSIRFDLGAKVEDK
jgi:hypothetical protein